MNKLSQAIIYTFLPVLILAYWQIVVTNGAVSPIFLPKPGEVYIALVAAVQDGSLPTDMFATLYRLLAGFAIGALCGVPIGLLMGSSKTVYRFSEFTVEFFRAIPVTALFPLFLLLFGIGDKSKIGISAWAAGLIIILHSMHGVHMASEVRRRAARIMRLTSASLYWRVILPEAAPYIASGFRVALSLSLIIVVVVEMFIGTNHGLGHRIINSQLTYRIADMYMAIFITGLLGFVLNKVLLGAEKQLIHWKGK